MSDPWYSEAIVGDTALSGSLVCDSWFEVETWECDAVGTRDPVVFATAATEVLYLMTGKQWPGICPIEVRPCAGPCGCGEWSCDVCRLPCGWAQLPFPTYRVAAVTVDGVDLLSDDWRLANRNQLVKTTGFWPWQNYQLAAGETGTWSVRMDYGSIPPPLGIIAARSLACWLAAQDSSANCALPAHVRSLTRQGINQVFDDTVSGGLALADVDLFLKTYCRGTADVWSPDLDPLPLEVL